MFFRYEGDNPQKSEQEKQIEEKEKLQKLLKKIEKNKKSREKQKLKERDQKEKQREAKRKTLEHREFKRKIKAGIIPVPEQNIEEFIDKSITESEGYVENNSNEIKEPKLKPVSIDGFTILGDDTFSQKKKVRKNI